MNAGPTLRADGARLKRTPGRPVWVAIVLAATLLMLAGCGSSGSGSPAASPPTKLTVFGAASLTDVFPKIATAFQKSHAGVEFAFNFAGTDTLVAQIEQGAPADVFAGASSKYGDQLSGEGLVDTPQIFATNKLVVILPADNPAKIESLADLAHPGVKVVVGAPDVPIGSYTATVLQNLDAVYGADYATKVQDNVVSEAPDVAAVKSSIELGEADAGFVYVSDALSEGGKVKQIDIPASAQPVPTYPIAVVKSSTNAAVAQEFVTFVMGPEAQALLRAAGFGPPPK